MNNKIYAVSYGYDDISVGYFKTEKEAKEYCKLMDKNGEHYGGHYYREFELLDLNKIKKDVKYCFNITISAKVDDNGIFSWEIDDFKALSTTKEVDKSIRYEDEYYGFEIKTCVETENKALARNQIIDLMNEIQNKYYERDDLEMAIKEVVETYKTN